VTGQAGPTLEDVERQYISNILKEEKGKVAHAAVRLGIPRSTLYQKIKVYGIQLDELEERLPKLPALPKSP